LLLVSAGKEGRKEGKGREGRKEGKGGRKGREEGREGRKEAKGGRKGREEGKEGRMERGREGKEEVWSPEPKHEKELSLEASRCVLIVSHHSIRWPVSTKKDLLSGKWLPIYGIQSLIVSVSIPKPCSM